MLATYRIMLLAACRSAILKNKIAFQVPATEDEWKKIERGFNTRWNFPGAHGAIDGKHICIQAPPDCGSDYFNYKGSNSIVLMAVVDDDYCFIYANIGANGRCSDGGVFQKQWIFCWR